MRYHRSPSLRILAAAFSVALVMSTLLLGDMAQAAAVYSNLGAGGTFNASFAYEPTGSLAFFGSDADVAARFTVGSSAYTLTSADLALTLFDGTNSLNVYLLNDSGPTGPGSTVLASASITGLPVYPAGSLVNVGFSGSFTLLANTTYWLIVDGSGSTDVGWFLNDQIATGTAVRIDGGAWIDQPDAAPAFRVNGTLSNAVGVVPASKAVWSGLILICMLLGHKGMCRTRLIAV